MTMDVVFGSLFGLLSEPKLVALMLAAIPLGMIFGAIPGLGGKLGLVLAIPFVFGMDAVPGAVFLVAMHAVVHTGGAIPSILLGIPGSGPDAATVCDGHPMTLRGEAGRALGAALAASAVGGVVGAAFLAVLVPIVQPVALAFGPAEFFFLAVLGITFIGAVSGQNLAKGLIVGSLGLMLSFVGTEPLAGIARFTMGATFLQDGISVITAVLAIFTIPETISLATSGSAPRTTQAPGLTGAASLMGGVADVWTHRWLTLRSSLIGSGIGLVPGLGGDVGSWTAYGQAVITSRSPERFGKGTVEGVIAPEAANNSKEGGALLPTLFFGIPGSSGMVILLGAFVVLGIQPGPAMLRDQPELVWTLIWTLVVSNVLAALVFLAVGPWLVLAIRLRAGLLVPFVILLTILGVQAAGDSWHALIVLFGLGLLGYGFKRGDWPRAPFAIGIVLGPVMEISLHQSLAIWGPSFVLRPGALVLVGAIAATIALAIRRGRRSSRRLEDAA